MNATGTKTKPMRASCRLLEAMSIPLFDNEGFRDHAEAPECLLEAENIFLLRPLHPLLPVLLPDARPGPPVHVRHLDLDRGARRDRRRPALERIDRLHALDERLRVALLESADPLNVADDAHRLDERLGVVQNRLVIEAEERAVGVAVRRVDFDRLHAARV